MTAPAPDAPTANDDPLPFGLHVASILCWVVGGFSVLGALALGLPLPEPAALGALSLGANLVAAASVCITGVLLRRRRRLAGLSLAAAWLLPALVTLATGGHLRVGGYLLGLATLTVAVHWKLLR